MKPHLLALFGPVPDPDGPSGRVYWRHLRRFVADGWRVTLTGETEPSRSPDSAVSVLPLPTRRVGWPPVRTRFPFTVDLRNTLLARHVVSTFRHSPPDLVLAGGGHAHLGLARLVARRFDCPLHVILHDWWPEFCPDTPAKTLAHHLQRRTFRSADCVWAVSANLAAAAQQSGARHTEVLPPIPDAPTAHPTPPTASASGPLHLAAFGSYAHWHAPVYSALAARLHLRNGHLTVVTPQADAAARDLSSHTNVDVRPYFASPSEALHFASTCSAIVVAQPLPAATHRWTLTSFPSKLVEFVHTKKPVLILADSASAVGTWAADRHWQPYAPDLSNATLDAALDRLASPPMRTADATRSAFAADHEFAAPRIHEQLRSGLVASLHTRCS